ncbi:MAG: cytochrome C oxidase subunit IV family protein [Mycobacterium sp.]|nr:cytochrome C oxidase subunit IV family protein [Mycobacterium sp.]
MTQSKSTTVVWAVLSAMTVVSWFLAPAHRHGAASASTTVTIAVLMLAAVKTRLIIRHFMEVRCAPRWLKLATDGWQVVLFGAILAIYLW